MKIFDISQELFDAYVYPGDPVPEKNMIMNVNKGDKCNLTSISMCCHNGTHIDAPFHFLSDGKTIEEIELSKVVGSCNVVICKGEISKKQLMEIVDKRYKKILFKGDIEISIDVAKQIANSEVDLIGVENCTVGNSDTGEIIHKIFLEKEIVILEGVRLDSVEEGEYFLCAQPIKIKGVDGAPCRAVLIQ